MINKVWSSTKEGNERLNQIYLDSLQNGNYPIFLFFSVNQSGQFCGVAQMTSPVDFNSDFSNWTQQKKWSGTFNVSWLFVKDILNKHFKALPNKMNENKPVTNSRDTQEVPFSEGLRMLEIFKDFKEETSIFDDFQNLEKEEFKKQSKIMKSDSKKDYKSQVKVHPSQAKQELYSSPS